MSDDLSVSEIVVDGMIVKVGVPDFRRMFTPLPLPFPCPFPLLRSLSVRLYFQVE